MPAKWIIHTPGPIWRGGQHDEENLLANCYRNSILLAAEHRAETISFPSISMGVYGFPIERASKIALSTVIENLQIVPIKKVHFVLYSNSDFKIYEKTLSEQVKKWNKERQV